MVTIVVIAAVTAGVVLGSGAVMQSRVRGASAMITGAIRTAFTRASATSRVNRLVLDLDGSKISLEESNDAMLLRNETTGGSDASTPEERDALEQAARILKGPQIARPRFAPVKALGFDDPDTSGGRPLGKGVKFRKVESGHQPDGQTSGRAYLYFWPGGQTERASIQIAPEGSTETSDGMTLLVSPLTGRVRIERGAKSMEPLRDDGTSSEREERPF
jgi:general secretion pathway protein H